MRAPRRGIRPVRLVGILLAALAVLLAVPDAAGGAAETATTAGGRALQPVAGPPGTVLLQAFSPRIPRPGSILRIAGRVANSGPEALEDVQVRLRISRAPLQTRSQVGEVVAGNASLRRGIPVEGTLIDVGAVLRAGRSAPFDLRIEVDRLDLRGFGVYVLGVEALAADEPVGVTRTFLPWVPPGARFRPVEIAWLWPLADGPRRDAAGRFRDDGLTGLLRTRGRLHGLLEAVDPAPVPVTWVVDPMLLDDVLAMTSDYLVRTPTGTVPGAGTEAARDWLGRVVAADAPAAVLPYGDPDVVAMARAGALTQLRAATELGRRRGEDLLGEHRTPGGLALPPEGMADAATVRVLRDLGARGVVLRGGALPPREPLSYTPTGRAQLDVAGQPLAVLLSDERLGATAATVTDRPGAPVLAAQQFLAETAMLTAERPSSARAVLVAPPRRWNPTPEYAATLLTLTRDAPWLSPITLAELASRPAPEGLVREPLRLPEEAVEAELPASHLAAVERLVRDVAPLGELLDVPGPDGARSESVTEAWSRQGHRLRSATYRGSPRRRVAALAASRRDLEALRGQVRILPASVTLGDRRGPIPVTVVNDLDAPVRVRLSLTPRNPRLAVHSADPVTIAARRTGQVLVPATARANGLVGVDAQLFTPAGVPYGGPVLLRVRVTQVGAVGMYVTAGAAVLLVGAAGVRLLRRVRSGRGPRPDPERSGEPPLGEPPSGEPPSDAAPAPDAGENRSPPEELPSRSLARSSGVMAVGTALSRVTGFLRTAVLAAALGTALLADTYNVAHALPTILYILLAGGVLNAVFVPQLVRARKEHPDGGAGYADRLLTLTGLALAGVTAVTMLAAPLIVTLYAPDFGPRDTAVAVAFTLWSLPQIFFYGVFTMLGQVLNARGRFGPMMWAPILNNLLVIAVGVLFVAIAEVERTGPAQTASISTGEIALLGAGSTAGVVVQTLALVPALRRSGYRYRFATDFRGFGLRRAATLAKWTVLFVAVNQVGYLVVTRVGTAVSSATASLGYGAGFTAYQYAHLLFLLPHSIVTVSVVTALLPRMSRAAVEGRPGAVATDLAGGLRLCAVAILPAVAAFLALGRELAAVPFAGAGLDGARYIGWILTAFAPGLLAFTAHYVALRGFYAQEDTRTPFVVNVVVNVVNVTAVLFAYAVLPLPWVAVGMAGGYSLAYAVGALLSFALLRRGLGGFDARGVRRTWLRLGAAALLAALPAFATARAAVAVAGPGFPGALSAAVTGGGVLLAGYLLLATRLRVPEVAEVLGLVKGRFRPTASD